VTDWLVIGTAHLVVGTRVVGAPVPVVLIPAHLELKR
jgi:hypothetical protein